MPAADVQGLKSKLTSVDSGEAVVLDTEFSTISRALWVGVGGDLSVVLRNGATVVLKNVGHGTLLNIRATTVTTANTTATDIVALW